MALINCPECGKQVSDKAESCPNCGCPISQSKSNNTPSVVKVRCLTDDRKCVGYVFKAPGRIDQYCGVGNVINLYVKEPTRFEVIGKLGILPMNPSYFSASPGKCYEVKYCKPGIWQWTVVISEVSIV